MTGWDIDIPGVKGVVGKIGVHGQELGNAATSMSDDLETGVSASGSEKVMQAIMDWANVRGPDLTAAATRVNDAENAVVNATVAYAKGDLTMAATAQRVASQSPWPKPIGPGPNGGQRPR